MPKYRVELEDGRVFEVETDGGPPTPDQVASMVPRGGAPVAPPSGGSAGPGLPESHTMLETTFEVLNTVPRLAQQAVTSGVQVARGKETVGQALKDVVSELNPYSKTTGETPLEELGMGAGLGRTVLGLGLDLVSPMGPTGAILRGGLGLAGRGAKAAINASPAVAAKVEAATKPVEKLFVQYPGMSKLATKAGDQTAEDKFRLHEAKLRGIKSTTESDLAKLFSNIPVDERRQIADFINDPKQFPLPGNRLDLHQASAQLENLMHTQFMDEVKKGVSNPNKYIQDYFPWIVPHEMNPRAVDIANFKGTSRFSKTRTLPDWQTAKAHKAETDAAVAVSRRLEAGQRATANVDFFEDMAKEFGQTLKQVNPQTGAATTVPMPAGYRQLNLARTQLPETSKVYLNDIAFPKELADQLEKGHIMWADPDGFLNLVKKVNQGFKTWVTTFNPAHHMNNFQGNINLMRLGGMSPKAIAQAYTSGVGEVRDLTGAGAAAFARKPLTQQVSMGEAWDAATKYNLFGSNEAAIEMARLGARSMPRKVADEARLQTSRVIEDPARWALFKDFVQKAKPPATPADKQKLFEQAAIHVKNHLFDYSELTDFERGLRDYGLVPFYSWLRKNTALQLKSMINDPQKWRQLQVLYEAPERIAGGDDSLMPEWMKEEGYIPLGMDEQGNQKTVRAANPALDLNKLASPVSAGIGGALGPIPRAAIEGMTGRNIRTGRQVLGTETGYTPASALGTALETAAMKTGLPIPSGGTIPTLEGTILQPEMLAFAMSQIPLPMVPYMQQVMGAAPENIGTQLQTPMGRRVMNTFLRSLGLTPRDLTLDQQLAVMDAAIKKLVQPVDTQVLKETGKAIREAAQKQ